MPEMNFKSAEARAYIREKSATMNRSQRQEFYSTLDKLTIGSFDERITDFHMVTGIIDIVATYVLNE